MTKELDPRGYIVTADAELRTVDLDREEFILHDGRRLTEELPEQLEVRAALLCQPAARRPVLAVEGLTAP